MSESEELSPGPALEDFLDEPTRDLEAWRWLWEGDHAFPVRSHRGLASRLVVFCKRLLRPLVKVPQNDLWERQRVFNLILLERLERSAEVEEALAEIDRMRWTAQEFKDLSVFLSRFARTGVGEIVSHNDALFARVDQKLDRYRRESQRLWAALNGALAQPEAATDARGKVEAAQLGEAVVESAANRWAEPDVPRLLQTYAEILPLEGTVLQLDGAAPSFDPADGSVDAVISFHSLRLATTATATEVIHRSMRQLRPGGTLLIETSDPSSVDLAAKQLGIAAEALPILPAGGIEVLMRAAGFDPVRRLQRPGEGREDGLPEISLEGLEGDARQLADRVNRLRDRLDDLLCAHRDCAILGTKPES